MTPRVLVDSDVILDFLLERKPFNLPAQRLFRSIEEKRVIGNMTVLMAANLFYILRKIRAVSEVKKGIHMLTLLMGVLPVTAKEIDLALLSSFNDFEDAIQYYVAKAYDLSHIVTRNKKDYAPADLIVCTAEEFGQMAL